MKLWHFAAGGAVSAVAILAGATPAIAAPGCDGSSFLCVYQYHDYDGGQLFTSQTNDNWPYLGNPYAFRFMNDKMSSVVNTTSRTYAHVYENSGFKGYDYCILPATSHPNVSNNIENKSSSHKFASGC